MQKYISNKELMLLEKQERVNLVNSLGGFKSVGLIGTIDVLGNTNLAIFSSIFHIGANPALIAFIVRPGLQERHTLNNILETQFYTINHINKEIYKQAHQTSARYNKEISEFDATELTPEYKNNFKAPFVKESIIQIGIQFKEKIEIAINSTTMIIGEIIDIYLPTNCFCEDGFIDIEKAGTITCSGLDSYYKTERIERLNYAKPNKELKSLTLRYVE